MLKCETQTKNQVSAIVPIKLNSRRLPNKYLNVYRKYLI